MNEPRFVHALNRRDLRSRSVRRGLTLSGIALLSLSTCAFAEKAARWTVWQEPGVPFQNSEWPVAVPILPVPINNPDIRIFPSADPQTELSIAINAANPLNLLVTGNSIPSSSGQGYYYTLDGGVTWSGSNLFPVTQPNYGDPVAVFDGVGKAYDVTLRSPSGIAITTSLNGGATWTPAVNIDPASSNGNDKEHATADRSPGSPYLNRFYSAWTDFNTDQLVLVTSGDNFSTRHILNGALSTDGAQGVNLQVGPGGEVYACWSHYANWNLPEAGCGFSRSLDGGATWAPARVIFPYQGIRMSNGADPLFNNTRVNSFPWMTVDISNGTYRGRIYIVYADRSTGDSDIYIRHSDDMGTTWSSALRVNGDPVSNGRQQWFPCVSSDPLTGDVSVAYYNMDQPTGFSTKYWVAHSANGGTTFETFPVSDVGHIPTQLGGSFASGYAGDYYGVASFNGRAWAAWSDNRSGQYNAYVQEIVYADPTDPNPPSHLAASSSYLTPNGITLDWIDPVTLVSGDSLTSFEILIERDGTPLDTVSQGLQTFQDGGLVDGQLYNYDLRTRDLATDSLSMIVSIGRYAGGDPVPGPPTQFSIVAGATSFQLTWTNPSVQRDGSALDDFAGINVYRNGALLTSLPRAPGDAGNADSYTDSSPAPGVNCYLVSSVDSESPSNESTPTEPICVETPLLPPFSDNFPAPGPPDDLKWTGAGSVAVISTRVANPPSPPYACDFLGVASLTSLPIDISGSAGQGIVVYFRKEQGGYGEQPDPGNDLIVELLNSNNTWTEIMRFAGSDPGETQFTTHMFDLDATPPATGSWFHSQFRLRFRTTGDPAYDDWFVDDVAIQVPSCGPTITVTPIAVSDTLAAGSPAGTEKFVQVDNSCFFDILHWTAAMNPPVPWLAISGGSGSINGAGTQTFSTHFNAVGLSPGAYSASIDVTSDDPANPVISIAASLLVIPAPVITVVPDSLFFTTSPGAGPETLAVTIGNTGAGPLEFAISDVAGTRSWRVAPTDSLARPQSADRYGISAVAPPIQRVRTRPKHPEDDGTDFIQPPQPFGQGGPDAGGYIWIDSDEPGGPVFDWVDITSTGTLLGLSGDDVYVSGVPLGISFPFYGNEFQTVNITSNGFVSFTYNGAPYSNYSLPSQYAPGNMLAPFWADLYVGSGTGSVFVQADAANSRTIIEYFNVPLLGGGNGNTFEIILNQDGSVLFQYLDMGGSTTYATTGIQNSSGTVGLTMAYNQAYLHNGLAVRLSRDATWLQESPTTGVLNPGGSMVINVIGDPAGLGPGRHTAEISIKSNDPVTPNAIVAAQLSLPSLPVPFCDNFDVGGAPDPLKWTHSGVVLNTNGLNEPSPPASADLNDLDVMTSTVINTSGLAGHGYGFSWFYEQTGGGEPPDTGNDLILEFRTSTGQWDQIARQLGSGPDMTYFQNVLLSLDQLVPSSGTYFYSDFQLRFRSTGDSGSDDWFVDTICLDQFFCNPEIVLDRAAVADTLSSGSIGAPKELNITDGCSSTALAWSISATPPVPWMAIAPSAGTIQPLTTVTVAFTFSAIGLVPGLYETDVHVISNDPDNPDRIVHVSLAVGLAPHIAVSPDSISAAGISGGVMVHAPLQIESAGGGYLRWLIGTAMGIPAGATTPNPAKLARFAEYTNLPDRVTEPGTEPVLDASGNYPKGVDGPATGPRLMPYGQGGPDPAGYRWIDSDQTGGPAFLWSEIVGHGGIESGIRQDDQNRGPFSIGFPFPFYGNSYGSIRICSNGWISPTATEVNWTNLPFPTAAVPNNVIAPLWDDLQPGSGRIYYLSDPAHGRFIVQFQKMTRYSSPTDSLTFQVILGRDGSIQYNYLTLSGALDNATIGIENSLGTIGLTVVHNAIYLHNGLSVLVLPPPSPWLSTSPVSSTVLPGEISPVDVSMDPHALAEGLHRAWLHVSSNDPDNSWILVPVDFTVQIETIPVVLSRFDAIPGPDGIDVSWETAIEEDHSHFDLFRCTGPGDAGTQVNPVPIAGGPRYTYRDEIGLDGRSWWYRLEAIDRSGVRSTAGQIEVRAEWIPLRFHLAQNRPNPFRTSTRFEIDLPASAPVSARMFDAAGRLVRTLADGSPLPPGRTALEWDGRDVAGRRLPAGIYFLRVEAGSQSRIIRMTLSR